MKDIIIHCKKFEEWDEATQEVILNKHRYIEVEFEWYDFLIEEWKMELESMGFEDPKIEFSGFNSQGDGASFTAEPVDMEEILKTFKGPNYKSLLRRIKKGTLEISGHVYRSGRYVHERSTYFGTSWNWLGSGKYSPALEEEIEAFEDYMGKEIIEINTEIYKDLEEEYDARISDDNVRECLIANEYEFDKTGKIW